jgi:large subunit ribosomal protein L22
MPGPKTNEREGTRAVLHYARVSPYKLRQVIDVIRGKPVEEASDLLRFVERDAAIVVGKLLQSAVANAANNDHLDPEELYVSACFVDEGPTAKRWRPRARGRSARIRKRSSHITIIVSRLPEDRLVRLQARRRAENLAMRARRVEATRRAGAGAGAVEGQNRRERRHPETIPAAEEAPGTEEGLETEGTTSAEAALLGEVAEEEPELEPGEDEPELEAGEGERELEAGEPGGELEARTDVEPEAEATDAKPTEAKSTDDDADEQGAPDEQDEDEEPDEEEKKGT